MEEDEPPRRPNREIAECLEREKEEVSQIGFALGLLSGEEGRIDGITYRINNWIDEACQALRRGDT